MNSLLSIVKEGGRGGKWRITRVSRKNWENNVLNGRIQYKIPKQRQGKWELFGSRKMF